MPLLSAALLRGTREDVAHQLMLDYVPGASKQSWTVADRKTLKAVGTGTDDAKRTTRTICLFSITVADLLNSTASSS